MSTNMIAGIGFAQMAWKEAIRRSYPWPVKNTLDLLPIQQTERCEGAAEHCEHCEYFNMLDRALDAWKCNQMVGAPATVKL